MSIMSIVLKWHLVKFNTTVTVNFSNIVHNYVYAHCRALTVKLQKILYNTQASVGEMQYTIILFISNIFLPTIVIYLNDREKGRH